MVRDFYVLAIASIRAVLPDLPILLHDSFHGDMWAMMLKYFPYDNVYMDTHLYHGFNPSDIGALRPAHRRGLQTHKHHRRPLPIPTQTPNSLQLV